jgi:hypothetical protein
VAFEEFVDRSSRSSVTGCVGILSHDETANPRLSRLVRIIMDSIVANQRVCHADDLTTKRGIGRYFLVTDHRGGEYHFTRRVYRRTKSCSPKYPTIR